MNGAKLNLAAASGTARPGGRMVSRWRLGLGALLPFWSIPDVSEIDHRKL